MATPVPSISTESRGNARIFLCCSTVERGANVVAVGHAQEEKPSLLSRICPCSGKKHGEEPGSHARFDQRVTVTVGSGGGSSATSAKEVQEIAAEVLPAPRTRPPAPLDRSAPPQKAAAPRRRPLFQRLCCCFPCCRKKDTAGEEFEASAARTAAAALKALPQKPIADLLPHLILYVLESDETKLSRDTIFTHVSKSLQGWGYDFEPKDVTTIIQLAARQRTSRKRKITQATIGAFSRLFEKAGRARV